MQVLRSEFKSRSPGSQSGRGLLGMPIAKVSALPHLVMPLKKAAPSGLFYGILLGLSSKILRDEIPVDQVPECRDIIGPTIAIIHVVGVLPHVAG